MNNKKYLRQPVVAVSCSGKSGSIDNTFYEVGKLIAQLNCTLATGGGGGVMLEVCRGAAENGGLTIGILPSKSADDGQYAGKFPNKYVHVPIYTGMSVGRNSILAYSADILIALPGSAGTLSEISMALNVNKPVVVAFWENFSLPFDLSEEALSFASSLEDIKYYIEKHTNRAVE